MGGRLGLRALLLVGLFVQLVGEWCELRLRKNYAFIATLIVVAVCLPSFISVSDKGETNGISFPGSIG